MGFRIKSTNPDLSPLELGLVNEDALLSFRSVLVGMVTSFGRSFSDGDHGTCSFSASSYNIATIEIREEAGEVSAYRFQISSLSRVQDLIDRGLIYPETNREYAIRSRAFAEACYMTFLSNIEGPQYNVVDLFRNDDNTFTKTRLNFETGIDVALRVVNNSNRITFYGNNTNYSSFFGSSETELPFFNVNLSLRDVNDVDESVRIARENGVYFVFTRGVSLNSTNTAMVDYTSGMFSIIRGGTLLGSSSFNTDNVKYYEDYEDDYNTYPGGGEDSNQYPEDGESGKGTFDNSNDEVDFPPMPTKDATSTGFISMWNPTIAEIYDLYGFLWDSDISTTLKKLFLEPMDAIISLAYFPVDPTNFPDKRNVTIGHVDTEIQMYAVQKQFVDFDFGELVIDEYYGAAWDYSPYTQASIYLPYIGTQALDIDDVMNGTLHLKYRVDLLSGMCAAMLRVDRSRDGLQAVIYTWQGNCAMQVPITAGSARDFLNSIIQLGAMAGVSLAQPLAGAIDASMHKGEENYQSPIMGNNWINPTITTFSALNVIGQKVRVQRGGRVDANAGVMSPQEAYIILNRPVSAIPRGWNEYAGYPSLKVKTLSTQKGYTEIAYIKLNGLEATSDEIMELDGMLKGGVIL